MKELIPNHYKKSETYLEAVKEARQLMTSSRFNTFQNSPIICKAQNCAFYNTCPFKDKNMKEIKGLRCPFEVALGGELTDKYINHFLPQYNEEDADPVIMDLIKELVDYEVQINRADRIMADRGDFLEDVVVGVSVHGDIISNKEVAQWVSYKNALTEKKHKTLQLLNSTPKDRASTVKAGEDFASYVKMLKEKAKLEKAIEVEASHIDE
jgi:hypothetical protein